MIVSSVLAQSSLHAAELPGDVAAAEFHRRDKQLVALDDPRWWDGWMDDKMDGCTSQMMNETSFTTTLHNHNFLYI
jgi:hypothetical protein